ncbi:hypothetical protein BGZ65_000608 [Modicella reniformis]|uniref:Uncharacterized protein n=1 Tax=Modicella reniformis TaxID=1440133 RepID=A0A9P6SVK5_9FUNG|nr:hypothetical protein BGZ65_000608 [Modicella reniformis]
MEEYLCSSEAFAKALKGSLVLPSEKIHLAREAWQRKDVVLPHKQEFLLEWLCTTLVKSSTPSKNPKDTSSSVVLDQDYWRLFKDMLSGITCNRKKHRKYGIDIGTGPQPAFEHQAPGVLLRMSVIPIFTALILHLAAQTTSPASLKQGKKAAVPTTLATTQYNTLESPSAVVLQSAFLCFELLSSPLMSEWFQPTLEQYTPLVQATLEALIEMEQESSNINMEKKWVMMSFAPIVLDRFKKLIVIQPNQRKVFAVVAGKMFEDLVRARIAIRSVSGPSTTECHQAISMILKTGLFHHEHLQEYTAGYVGGDEKSIKSYQKQLFEQIAGLIKSKYSTAVLDVLPTLLCYFVEETRKKQRSIINSGFDRGMDSTRETEFAFFKILYVLAKKQLPQLAEDPSDDSVRELANVMDAHNHLLSSILELNMYQPSNDETTDQFVFMSTAFESAYTCLTTAQTLLNGSLQSISLAGIVVLAQLDDRLLKPHLHGLWPVLFCPLQGADAAALELAKTLLEIYGKASDLKEFLSSLFSSMREYLRRPEELRSSPLFSKPFLNLVPINIRNHLPLPQAPGILGIFETELMALDCSMEIEGFEPIQEPSYKKRKLDSGNSKDYVDKANHISSAEFVTAIFVQFLKGLRVTTNQEKQLNRVFKGIYDHYLRHIFETLGSNEDGPSSSCVERSESYQQRRLTPALQLHYALCRISTQYWSNGVSMALIEKMVATFRNASGWTDPTVFQVVLQHIHLSLFNAD